MADRWRMRLMWLSDKIANLALGGALAAACTGYIGDSAGGDSSLGSPSGSSGGGSVSGSAGGSSGGATVAGPASLLNLPAPPLPTTGLPKPTSWEFAHRVQ